MKFHNRHHANEGLVNFDDLNLMDDDSHKLIVYDDLFENLIADAEGCKVVKNLLQFIHLVLLDFIKNVKTFAIFGSRAITLIR